MARLLPASRVGWTRPRVSRSARKPARKAPQKAASPTPSSVEIAIRTPEANQSHPPGYFGPSSIVSTLTGSLENTLTPSDDEYQGVGSRHSVLPSYWVTETTKMLSILTEGPTIERLVCEFYGVTHTAVLPTAFVLSLMNEVREFIKQSETSQTLHEKTIQVLESTAQRPRVPSDIMGRDFHKLFSSNRMRLEIIGVVYAIAGRASFFGFAQDKFPAFAGNAFAERLKFSRRMLSASETAVQICRMLTPTNDLTAWMLYENWLLSCMFHGDSSRSSKFNSWLSTVKIMSTRIADAVHYKGPPTWNRLGELSSCIFELGLHRDSHGHGHKGENIPVFLREVRRRLYAGLYHNDKNIATFFGRPPRVSWRHSDCGLPLDISEEALLGDEQDLERAMAELDSEGWSVNATFRRASWYRIRYLVSSFREEILELSLRPLDHEAARRLRLLAQHDPSAEKALLDIVLYGFSSAGTLIKALQTQARTGNPIPYTGSRAELIRNLSVFNAHIESMARPLTSNLNYALFERASKMFTDILDEILESSLPVSSATANAAEVGMVMNTPAEEDMSSWAADGMEFLDTLDFNVVFDQWVF
ncbi:predicted protein [Aspergillus nidulans FGSC A4]|nr:predicted protein [Aspergillus nidulans FGSC A4]|eukprot:XP_658322.1 predicted protein [Aspergillus nidulans FGSC A4]